MSETFTQVDALLQRGDVRTAAALLSQAEAAGDAEAARQLAFWLLEGKLVKRSLAQSRAYFERAAMLGDAISLRIARNFIASGVGGPADWPRAVEQLKSAAASDPEAARELRLIEKMAVGINGEPLGEFAAEPLSEVPDVRIFRNLFTSEECEYLIEIAQANMRPSVVVDPRSGQFIPHPIRTSSGTAFPYVDENPAIHALNRRLAAASGTDVKAGEPAQILQYAVGQEFRQHSDAMNNVIPAQQRVFTFLVYLDADYEGGETFFPVSGISFRGRTGDGLLFRNASNEGVPDPNALHAGLPVKRGVKRVLSRWIRASALIVE